MTILDVDVSELTKEYAILNGEKIVFDEPFEETPNKADFIKWLTNIKNELVKDVIESEGNTTEIQNCTQQSD
jgi:hypothetical protein